MPPSLSFVGVGLAPAVLRDESRVRGGGGLAWRPARDRHAAGGDKDAARTDAIGELCARAYATGRAATGSAAAQEASPKSQADEKGSLRVRPPGELIHDKLFGQKGIKMISLPPVAAAVLAAAAAAARAALPPRHRMLARIHVACARPPQPRTHTMAAHLAPPVGRLSGTFVVPLASGPFCVSHEWSGDGACGRPHHM